MEEDLVKRCEEEHKRKSTSASPTDIENQRNSSGEKALRGGSDEKNANNFEVDERPNNTSAPNSTDLIRE